MATKKGNGQDFSERNGNARVLRFRSREEIRRIAQEAAAQMEKVAEEPDARAQSMIYEAWEKPRRLDRIALARNALKIWPDCADAYVVLAEDAATSLEEEIHCYQEGVKAGERAIGREAFEQEAGNFWGVLWTRPYMRARSGLADSLWEAGRREEAISHHLEMLRLNSQDNQGVRYTLYGRLLELGRDNELARLLKQTRERSAWWAYTFAVLTFKQEGDSKRSRKLLTDAGRLNPHVPDFLLGRKPMPSRLPDGYCPGHEDEAIAYASFSATAWVATPGALQWLASRAR